MANNQSMLYSLIMASVAFIIVVCITIGSFIYYTMFYKESIVQVEAEFKGNKLNKISESFGK